MEHNTILIIDDDARVLKTFARNLRSEGYTVETAPDGVTGLRSYHQTRPDIVLLDVRLPGMDGFEVLHAIRQHNPDAEVILVTGHGDMKVAVSALRAGASDFITKPAVAHELEAALRRSEERTRLKQALRRAQQSVRSSEAKLRALLEHAPVGVVVVDELGHIVMLNTRAVEMFGYRPEELMGQMVEMLLPEEHRAIHTTMRQRYTQHPTSRFMGQQQKLMARRKNGTVFPVEIGLSVAEVSAGGHLIASYINDTTERYQTEAALLQAKDQAEEASRAKSTFLANMNHELRTPLNAILGFSQLLLHHEQLTSAQQEDLSIIIQSAEHLLALINAVLDFSKIEAGQVTLNPTAFNLCQMLEDIEDMLRIKAEEKALGLYFQRDENVPCHIYADELKLRQVLINLLDNALKFTQKGEIVLHARRVSPMADEDARIEFSVQDTGPGIAPEERKTLFEAFIQTNAGQRARQGTGLGLAISREFARLMGGELTVRSQPGQGACFAFDIPVSIQDAFDIPAKSSPRQVIGIQPHSMPPDGSDYRVLIAEGDANNRALLKKLLDPLGFATRDVEDGPTALKMWQRWSPHIALVDTALPRMSGEEVVERARACSGPQATVWIALTTEYLMAVPEHNHSEIFDAIITKPFSPDKLFECLKAHLPIRFIYAAQEPRVLQTPLIRASDMVEHMRELDSAMQEQLHQAVLRTDIEHIIHLITKIEAHDNALAQALLNMAERFDYNRMLTVLRDVADSAT